MLKVTTTEKPFDQRYDAWLSMNGSKLTVSGKHGLSDMKAKMTFSDGEYSIAIKSSDHLKELLSWLDGSQNRICIAHPSLIKIAEKFGYNLLS